MISEIIGDVTTPQARGSANVFVPHICNNVKAYAAGVAACIRQKWPSAYVEYMDMEQSLGNISVVKCRDDRYASLSVINMIAQDGLRSKENPKPIKYGALVKAMERAALCMKASKNPEVHCPAFGTGLAGGDWDIIRALIIEIWSTQSIPVTIYRIGGF